MYTIDISDKYKTEVIRLWREALNVKLMSVQFENIYFSLFDQHYISEEIQAVSDRLLVRLPIVLFAVVLFSFLSCITNKWLTSKPWLGPSACVSAVLAIASGFGLIYNIGIDYVDFNIGLCFIILGTEIDDAFVLISAWRCTSTNDSVEKRLGKAYSEAGVSITITSLTNFISFCIGMTAPFPAVQMFCGYAACCIFFTYVYQITFFGPCMALSGYREQKKLHPLTFCAIPEKISKDENELEEIEKSELEEDFFMSLFRDIIGHLLTLSTAKIVIMILFITNIGFGIWGFLVIKCGNDFSDVLSDDSSVNIYTDLFFKYFYQYYYPVQIIIDCPLNYEDPKVQKSLENMIQRFESHPHIADSSLRISWLKYYKLFSNMPIGKLLLRGYNMSHKQDFIDGLRNVFLRFPQAREFHEDIVFNENYTEIIASRQIILMTNIFNQEVEVSVMKDLYEIANTSPIPVKIHSLVFHLMEQALLIKNTIYELALMSAALICLVFFFFIPNVICALSISAIVTCIICETIGFASFLNVKMDMLLLCVLVLCVGFSINYPTHISYCFVVAKEISAEERIKKSIYQIGLPVLQGIFTTILGISVLPFEPYYSSISFFKVIFILSIQTVFHAIFVIPVILSLLKRCDKSLSNGPKQTVNDSLEIERLNENKA
ncbi:patched domain-containing protein 3-like [Centruroides vittatus]|uniref:patched domain-containing protein 3-like n=1 Tax=Centruroides vittatus TaxID=120091 RepID=UPI00350FD7DE